MTLPKAISDAMDVYARAINDTAWQAATGGVSKDNVPATQEALERVIEEHVGYPCEGCGEARAKCLCARTLAAQNTEVVRKLRECQDQLSAVGCTPAFVDVARERAKQRSKWGAQHDQQHANCELVEAAKDLLGAVFGVGYGDRWGLARKHDDERDRCVIAAALVIAHIERMDAQEAGGNA